MIVLQTGVLLASLALFAVAARWTFFSLLAWMNPLAPPHPRDPSTRFLVLLPAHNEAGKIDPTVKCIKTIDYPSELWRLLVLADNCDDATVAGAREAGAEVIERIDPDYPGKGRAIAWALERYRQADEALVIFDADSRPSPDYLQWMNRALAGGYGAAQGFNGTANAEESTLAALAAITSTMKNGLVYAGKAVAGRPVPLMNGLAISAATLEQHPWRAFSIVEDFETYLRLVDANVPIRFIPEAKIVSPRAANFDQATSQKKRLSGGQSALARQVGWPLLKKGLREKSCAKTSAALDVLLPGYAVTAGLLAIVALLGIVFSDGGAAASTGVALGGLLLLMLHFFAGLLRMEWTPKLLKAVALAPLYIGWKMTLSAQAMIRGARRWE